MAKLGHTATVTIAAMDVKKSIKAWEAVGFDVIHSNNQITRLTDGQLLLEIIEQEFPFFGVTYYGGASNQERELHGPDGSNMIKQRHAPSSEASLPSKEQSPLLGYFESFAIGVASLPPARAWAEDNGFFILEEYGDPHPQSDLTDGLISISLRQGFSGRWIIYNTELDKELVDDIEQALKSVDPLSNPVTALQNETGKIDVVRIDMPDGIRIVITQDM